MWRSRRLPLCKNNCVCLSLHIESNMKAFVAFFKLIRWPNLVFIALTQAVFFYGVVMPVLYQDLYVPTEVRSLFWILCISSVLIAAAGYIINDYFDLNIDLINKPDRLVVDRLVSRRWAIFFHMLFSMTGILLGFYIGLQNGSWTIGIANSICVFVLWFYSTTFKKKLLTGNILISLLTAWTVLVVYVYILQREVNLSHQAYTSSQAKLFRLSILYAAFAFIATLIREVVKDMEDIQGDLKYGCKTMPIVWGIDFTKIFTGIWMVILLVLLFIVFYYILQLRMWIPALYEMVLIILPAGYTLKLLIKAETTPAFAKISFWIKIFILTGILSMLFFKFY